MSRIGVAITVLWGGLALICVIGMVFFVESCSSSGNGDEDNGDRDDKPDQIAVPFDADKARSRYTPRTGDPIPNMAVMEGINFPFNLESKPASIFLNMALMSSERRMEIRFPGHASSGEHWLWIGSGEQWKLINGKQKLAQGSSLDGWTCLNWKGRTNYTKRTFDVEVKVSDPAEDRGKRVRIPTYWNLPEDRALHHRIVPAKKLPPAHSVQLRIPPKSKYERTLYIRLASLDGRDLSYEVMRKWPVVVGFQATTSGKTALQQIHKAENRFTLRLLDEESLCEVQIPLIPGGVRLEAILLLEPQTK